MKEKEEGTKEKAEEKKEPEKVTLEPVNEQPPMVMLPEREAKFLIDEITHICNIAQDSQYLGETTQLPRSNNFYIEEIFRVMREHRIIEE